MSVKYIRSLGAATLKALKTISISSQTGTEQTISVELPTSRTADNTMVFYTINSRTHNRLLKARDGSEGWENNKPGWLYDNVTTSLTSKGSIVSLYWNSPAYSSSSGAASGDYYKTVYNIATIAIYMVYSE